MTTVWLAVGGVAAFAAGATILGTGLRRHPSKPNAEKTSRVMHFLFFAGLGAPFVLALFHPGLGRLDALLGLRPLPFRTASIVLGIALAGPGLYLMAITNQRLRALGSGANAFRLTKRIVDEDIYQRTRNPMSLGYYLLAMAIGLLVGSTVITLAVLLGVIPAHVFFLKYFEEFELGLRFGDAYEAYKRRTPFLIPRFR